ncbi:MAG: aminotransferase class I/II-fold pyridoxal phosphate-dependent enzyme [Bacillota bacterium]
MRELEKEIEKYISEQPLRFHTPLHKGRDEAILKITAKCDVTEVGEFDNLHHQTGVIAKITEKCQEVFCAKKCYLSTQGTSLANLVMMRALSEKGRVAVLRSCHKSIYHAIDLFKIDAIFIDDFSEWKNGESVDIQKIHEALCEGAKSVVITCPSYYGDYCDLEEIRKLCDNFSAFLGVDEAHGTHAYFMARRENVPKACDFADVFSGSFHKALPAFTGSAILSVTNENLIQGCDDGFEMLHSTSPNYMNLLSIEHCVSSVEDFAKAYEDWEERRAWLSENLASAGVCEDCKADKGKLVLRFENPTTVVNALCEVGIFAEFSDLSRVVFLLNFLDTKEDYARLLDAIKSVKIMQDFTLEVVGENHLSLDAIENAEIIPKREVGYFHNGETEKILLRDGAGRISACNFGIYPPCFYLVTRGEVISEEILRLSRCGVDFFGVENGMVKVFKKTTISI